MAPQEFTPWASFLPEFLSEYLRTEKDVTRFERRFTAVALFADVSGFTAISEALGAAGRAGTEELTQILNDYFGPMIALIRSYGGIIGRFGGDAMTVLFPYVPESRRQAVRAALQCALDMQARMAAYREIPTSAGTFSLAMKAGLADGTAYTTVVGDPAYRLDYVIAGSLLDLSAEAEHHAGRGEVVAHRALLEQADGVRWTPRENDFALVQALEGESPRPMSVPALPLLPSEALQTVSRFLHPSVAERLEQGQSTFLNEHRLVTVVFVRFQAFDYDHDPRVGERLQAYFQQVLDIVRRYDGYLNKIDMGDKGSKYIVLFGTPIAHENDPERALRCALELRAIPQVPVHIGVNTGFVFCGQVGSKMRQEYTVMGDAVNLAARLMQSAGPDEIVVAERTFRAAQRVFRWGESRTLQVKGKQEAVSAHVLTDLSRTTQLRLAEVPYALPMVGRQAELQHILTLLERARQGQGQVIGLTAEAGMGKSRLAAEVLAQAAEAGWQVFGGECYSHATQAPYTVWQPILRHLLDISPAEEPAQQADHLRRAVEAQAPELLSRLPLLAQALHLPLEDNEWTVSLDARQRKEALEGMVVTLVRRRAATEPVLLALEDTHWIDALSNDLLEAVARNITDRTAALLVIYRPPETHRIQPQVFRLPHFHEIRLPPFDQAETTELVRLKLQQALGTEVEPPADLVQQIAARAEGNPFFVDELMNFLHDQGIDPRDPRALQQLELPASLHQVILSRIDRLSEHAKSTLRVASVVGRTFRASWLWGAYPPLGKPEAVQTSLQELSRLDITPLDRPAPEWVYVFKHIVTREVTYESMAHATRAMLHERIGAFIERTYADTLDAYLDLLAYHYGNSPNQDKQREYFRKAGEAARRAYANQAAVKYFQRLLPLLPEQERGEIWLALADIWLLTGEWSQAEQACRRAQALAKQHGRLRLRARALLALGTVLRQQGDYERALEVLHQSQQQAEALEDPTLESDVQREIGVVYWSQGNLERSLQHFQHARDLAETHNYLHGLFRATGNVGLVERSRGHLKVALQTLQQALQIARRLHDRAGVATALGNIGNVYWALGEVKQALEHYREQLTLAAEIGGRQGISTAVGNMGSIYEQYGQLDQALQCYAFDLNIMLEIGDPIGAIIAAGGVGQVLEALGQSGQIVHDLYRAAIQLARHLNSGYDLAEFQQCHAQWHYERGDYVLAQRINAEALSLAREADYPEVAFKAARLDVLLHHAMGVLSTAEAVARLEDMLAASENKEEQAMLHYTIWQMNPQAEEHCRQAAAMCRTLYQQLAKAEYRTWYHDLTGETLPPPPPLPPLPEIVSSQPCDLDDLLRRLRLLVAELGAQEEVCQEVSEAQ